MKLSFPLIAVCLLLCASVPVAYASGGGEAKKEGKKDTKAKAPRKARSITSLDSWVSVDPFTVAIIQDGRIRGRFMVSFGMDVPDATLRDRAEELMPRLRDAFLNDLSLYAATTLRPRRAADVAGLSTMLQGIADHVLGKPGSKILMAQATVEMRP